MAVILEAPHQRLVCPNCTAVAVWRGPLPAAGLGMSEMHACAGLRGFLAPMVLEGTDVKVEAIEREDYLGNEDVRLDGEGRPVMAVTTTYGDGRVDCAVFAPTAHAGGHDG